MARLRGDAVVLWRPPPGFKEPLAEGAVNPELIPAVVEALAQQGYLEAELVTGGVYNPVVAEVVKRFQADRGLMVDGVLGSQTLLQLWQGRGPTLVMK